MFLICIILNVYPINYIWYTILYIVQKLTIMINSIFHAEVSGIKSTVILLYVLFSFVAYLLIVNNKTIKKHSQQAYTIYIYRISGFFLFGLIPFIIIVISGNVSIQDVGVFGSVFKKQLIWLFVLLLIIIPISAFASRSEDNLAMYPQVRNKSWNINTLLISALTWIIYLLGYEFMFRGYMFFPLVDNMGPVVAIGINVLIYSFAHIPKGMKETIGAIPFGIILCLLVLDTGSFWIAFFAHVIMALSNEWFSLKYHPHIQLNI